MALAVRNGRRGLLAMLIGAIAGLISIGRLWLFDRNTPTEVLWAEDGLFTLCIHKADFWTCLTDPFAGYLLVAPRVLVWPISLLPWETWALAANLVAALLVGVIAGLVFVIARRYGLHGYASVAIALLPVITPMVGLEAINAIGSSYMLFLFLSGLLIVLPPREVHSTSSIGYRVFGFAVLLVTALTIPSAIVLIPILLVAQLRGLWVWRTTALWLAGLVVGLLAQFWIVINAESPRPVNFGWDTFNAWADAVPVSLLTFWPGLSIGEYSFFTNFQLSPVGITGWLIVVVFAGLGVWWIVRGSVRKVAVGLLLIAGLGLGLIPSAIGYPNNRYFVVPLLLWASALLIGLDRSISRAPKWLVTVGTIALLIIWWPALPASAYRATPAPPWSEEVARIEARCVAEPDFVDRPLFTPFWPPNWGDGLLEPTHPNLPCPIVYRWISP